MVESKRSGVIHLANAQEAIPGGERSISVLRRGTIDVRLALAPEHLTQETRHTQDEVYVVIRGRGVFVHDGKRDSFAPGDLLFVAAGTAHRWEKYTPDLVVWVVFYGPQGGEVPA